MATQVQQWALRKSWAVYDKCKKFAVVVKKKETTAVLHYVHVIDNFAKRGSVSEYIDRLLRRGNIFKKETFAIYAGKICQSVRQFYTYTKPNVSRV